MANVENLIYQHEGKQRETLALLHDWLTKNFNLTSKVTFGSPCYYQKSWICYLKATKKNTIEFTFFRGNELSNEQGLLENNGRKQLRSIELHSVQDIPTKELSEIIYESLALDMAVPYESKRKKKGNAAG